MEAPLEPVGTPGEGRNGQNKSFGEVYRTIRPTNDVSEVLKLQIWVEFSELHKLKKISMCHNIKLT